MHGPHGKSHPFCLLEQHVDQSKDPLLCQARSVETAPRAPEWKEQSSPVACTCWSSSSRKASRLCLQGMPGSSSLLLDSHVTLSVLLPHSPLRGRAGHWPGWGSHQAGGAGSWQDPSLCGLQSQSLLVPLAPLTGPGYFSGRVGTARPGRGAKKPLADTKKPGRHP